MGTSNLTRWCYDFDPSKINKSITQGCMAFTSNLKTTEKVSLLFTKEEINDKMSMQDVEKIVEIGNSLIFPATISTGKYRKLLAFEVDKFNNLEVKLREKKNTERYERSDAHRCLSGSVYRISVYERMDRDDLDIRVYIRTSEMAKGYSQYKCQQWQVSQNDFVDSKTGILLKDIIAEEIQKQVAKISDEGEDCIAITFDRGVMKSGMHAQATMTYYRMIFSDKYKGVLSDMLKYVKQGANSWEALSYSYASKNCDSYYGFSSSGHLFKNMNEVLNSLSNNRSINSSFSQSGVYANKRYLNNILKNPDDNGLFICIDAGNCKTLTMGKEYKCSVCGPGFEIICNDNVLRYIVSAKFSKK